MRTGLSSSVVPTCYYCYDCTDHCMVVGRAGADDPAGVCVCESVRVSVCVFRWERAVFESFYSEGERSQSA